MMQTKFQELAAQYQEKITQTASEMLQINSQSTQEGAMAAYTVAKMKELGYDEVSVSPQGNVFGIVHGTGGGSSVTLNCHLDVVHEGDPAKWNHPPYSGEIADGRIWGRGASDTKGTFAVQLYIPVILREAGLLPKGDILVAGVVSEEIGGFGAMMQARTNDHLTDYCVIGEATENQLSVGCRGCCSISVTITGKSCHASIPFAGKNPFDFLARFLPELSKVEMGKDALFGSSTMSCTKITSSEESLNIIPNQIQLIIDYRPVASDTEEIVLQKLRAAADAAAVDGISVDIDYMYYPMTTYCGYQGQGFRGEPPFSADPDAPYIQLCKQAVEDAVGHEVPIRTWPFATDTGHYAAKGVRCIGYSPAEIRLCHTTEDSIDLAMMEEGTAGYLALTKALADQDK